MVKIYSDLLKVKKLMGEHWQIKSIDFEPCLYRKLENDINIEVSGLNNCKRKKEVNVYVWSGIGIRSNTVAIYNRIKTFELLKNILNVIVAEWSCKCQDEILEYVNMLYKTDYFAEIEHHHVSPICCSSKKYNAPDFFNSKRTGADFEFKFKSGYCYE